ncbi:hypothetical protein GCM10007901_02470 [Dyella acidisoli]|uniref:Uncharacterized protein n=1 Tax=Dyella acidisoli TaxID=1867834 RepID=A0ABQ5XI74_9GAMM|nr:hypothetical protein GCM10007901_02470 [Dyella acidisoli]
MQQDAYSSCREANGWQHKDRLDATPAIPIELAARQRKAQHHGQYAGTRFPADRERAKQRGDRRYQRCDGFYQGAP